MRQEFTKTVRKGKRIPMTQNNGVTFCAPFFALATNRESLIIVSFVTRKDSVIKGSINVIVADNVEPETLTFKTDEEGKSHRWSTNGFPKTDPAHITPPPVPSTPEFRLTVSYFSSLREVTAAFGQ
jgi:hypothetical protein